MRPRWWIVLVIVVAVIALGATSLRRSSSSSRADADKIQPGQGGGGGRGKGGGAMNAPVPIIAAAVTVRDVPIYLQGLGSVIAYNTVTIKSRVDGELVKINFREGDEVKTGQVLAQIDPRPFEVQMGRAHVSTQ